MSTPKDDPYGIRTRVTAVKGRCLNHLTNGPYIISKVAGGEQGIRTLETLIASTRFPIVLLRPLGQLSVNGSAGRIRTYDRSVNSRVLYH